MKKILKKSLLIVLTIIMILSVTACHGQKSLPSFIVPDTFDTTKEYNITFWSKHDTNITQKTIYENAISEFEKLYPNIHVTMIAETDYQTIYNNVLTNISTNTTPNVCITYPDHVATYLEGNEVVVPLDDLFSNEKYGLGGSDVQFDSVYKNEIIDKFLYECVFDGHYYSIPFMRSTEACYINKDYVESLGYEVPDILTWDFMFEVSEKALEEKESDKTLIPIIYKSTDNMMIQMLKQKEEITGDNLYSDQKGNVYIFNDTTKEILTEISAHAGTKAFSTFKISSYPGNSFNRYQCIFAIDSTAGSTWMGPNATLMDISRDGLTDFEVVVRPVPQYDIENPKMISQGPSLCLFNKEDPQEVLASWLFMQYLITNDVQIAYSKTEGYLPVTNKAINSNEYQDYLSRRGEDNNEHYSVKIDATKLIIDNINNTFITPVFNGSTSLRNAAGALIEQTVTATRRKTKINDSYFNNLYKEVNSLYKIDSIEVNDNNTGAVDAKDNFGPLPKESVILISLLSSIWVIIGTCYIYSKIKK